MQPVVYIYDNSSDKESIPSESNLSSSSDDYWEQVEDLTSVMASILLPEPPTCTPQLYDSQSSSQPFTTKKFYLVYDGDTPGCYTTWLVFLSLRSEYQMTIIFLLGLMLLLVSSNVVVLDTRALARIWMRYMLGDRTAWRQNCLATHDHPSDFISNTAYVVPLTAIPRAITPPPHRPAFLNTAGSPSSVNCTSPGAPRNRAPTSPPSTPSKHRVGRAFFGPESPAPTQDYQEPTDLWVVFIPGNKGVFFSLEEADEVVRQARA
ncbi:hypothetical protein K435DRAFT_861823 [Dendrothele bispora CBS 962.96]|uniref:Uncharacterized protein n=1 Tax=Dendrothele bispora (strain CBS 962.96) TaxID=1314807 RepID=A0A4S8LU71_DENBC|nr:hypothetical protein K435DRAFT_861823 [Dendrothele bispora CBS 962.96]